MIYQSNTSSSPGHINLRTGNYSIQIMVEIGIVEIINMGGALGIIGTMFIVLYLLEEASTGIHCGYRNKDSQ